MAQKQLIFDRPARVRLFRTDTGFWVAQALVQTPTGVVGLQAAISEAKVLRALQRRAKRRTGDAISGGLFDSLKKAARKISKAAALGKVVKAAKSFSPAQLVKLVPAPIRKVAEGSAVKLLGAAMGGDKRARKALKALRAVAKQADPASQVAQAYGTVKRVARRMVKGDLKGVARALKNEALRQAAPINAVVETVESQISRLPSPLDKSARALVQTFPGVTAAYAVHAATEAYKQGKLFTPQGLISAASAIPGQPGAWARAAQPYTGEAPQPRSRNRYPMGYVRI